MAKNTTSKKSSSLSVRDQLKALAKKTTTIEIDGIDGPIHFRGLSTSVALKLRTFDPASAEAENTMIGVINDLAYDDSGKKMFDADMRFVDLPVEIAGQIMNKFSELISGRATVPLAQTKPPSTA